LASPLPSLNEKMKQAIQAKITDYNSTEVKPIKKANLLPYKE
jgi:hypothetical protein